MWSWQWPFEQKKKSRLKGLLLKYLLLKGGEMTVLQAFNAVAPGLPIIMQIMQEMNTIMSAVE
jgi:hypothetical protein